MFRSLKLSGAFLLLLGLFLPLSSCSHMEDSKGNEVSSVETASMPRDVRMVKDYHYALDDFDPAKPSSVAIPLAFMWPLLFTSLFLWLKHGPIVTLLRFAEPFLLAGSAFLIFYLATMGEHIELGAYLSLLGLGAYAIATLWEDVLCLSTWWEDRQRKATVHA